MSVNPAPNIVYLLKRQEKPRKTDSLKPAHIDAPVSKTDPARVKLTLQGQRLRCAQLERELR